MNQIVYCGENQVRNLPCSVALAPVEQGIVFRGEGCRRHAQCANDSVVVWWAEHNTLADFGRLLSVEMSDLRPAIVLFVCPTEMRQYLDVYASCWPDTLGNIKIFSSDALSLDAAASAAIGGTLTPTGKWIQNGYYSEINLKGPNKWLCNYCSESNGSRGGNAKSFELNPYDDVHVMRYVLGNAILGEDFKLLLYAHKTKYLPEWIASDLDWWPDSVKKKLWFVLYTGGDTSEISDAAHPEISSIRRVLSGRFARHSNFIQTHILQNHETKFDKFADFDPELPEPITLIAISILCQGYLAAENKGNFLLSSQVFNEIFGCSWRSDLIVTIQDEFGCTPPEQVNALICNIGNDNAISRENAEGVLKELSEKLSCRCGASWRGY